MDEVTGRKIDPLEGGEFSLYARAQRAPEGAVGPPDGADDGSERERCVREVALSRRPTPSAQAGGSG